MLSTSEKIKVLELINKVKKAKSLAELKELELKIKKIDFNNRKKTISDEVLNRYRR